MRPWLVVLLAVPLLAAACTDTGGDGDSEAEPAADDVLTVYSGREEELVGPIIERFEESSDIDVEVRYGDTAELAAQILTEGENTNADVFFAQDAGALGAVAKAGRFAELPQETLDKVPARFRSTEGTWMGTSGRARVLVYNTDELSEDDLPASVLDLTDDEWKGRIGWAPTNGSFQAFVTALRKIEDDELASNWLKSMKDNDAQEYDGNSAIVEAVASGEIDAGLVNHYYVLEMGAENPDVKENAANHFFQGGDVGSLVNVAGVGVIEGSDQAEDAQEFVDFMLSRTAREYFDEEVYEYPLVETLPTPTGLPDLDEIEQPDVDLSDLDDLEGTLELMRNAGVL